MALINSYFWLYMSVDIEACFVLLCYAMLWALLLWVCSVSNVCINESKSESVNSHFVFVLILIPVGDEANYLNPSAHLLRLSKTEELFTITFTTKFEI